MGGAVQKRCATQGNGDAEDRVQDQDKEISTNAMTVEVHDLSERLHAGAIGKATPSCAVALATIVPGVILDRVEIDPKAFHAGTGWAIKPEGACKGDVCVPLPGGFELTRTAERLGMALVPDEENRLWALGPESIGGRALVDAHAPDLVLADLDGGEFALSSLRGQKVVLVAWAPY